MARYFMSFFILTSCRVAGQSPIYALKGQEVNFKPAITGQPKEILWKYKGNKVVEFNGNEEQVYHPYEKRITLDWISAELNIAKLRYEDTGYYELEAYINQELKRSTFLLEVIDRVATPRISCEMEDGSSSATLVCSAEFRQPQSLMKLEWDSHGHVQPGPNFTISLGDKHDDEIYTCRVSNPLSNETATYTAKDCYPDKSSSAALIASVLTIVVIILLVVAIVYCKLRHKACFAKRKKGDSENPSTKGSDEKTAQGDENRSLLERAPTLPSTQPLGLLLQSNRNLKPNGLDRDHNENVNSDWKTVNAHDMSPPKGLVEQRKQQFENDGNISDKKLQKDDKGDADANEPEPAGVADKEDLEVFIEPEQPVLETALSEPDSQHSGLDNKGDANADHLSEDAGKKIPQCDPSDSEKANELDPAGLLEDSQSNLESSIAPVQPAHDMSPPKGLVEQRKQQFENDGNISDKKLHKDDKGDADANEPEPAGVADKEDLEVFSEPEQPVLETALSEPDSQHSESKKKTDDEEEA